MSRNAFERCARELEEIEEQRDTHRAETKSMREIEARLKKRGYDLEELAKDSPYYVEPGYL